MIGSDAGQHKDDHDRLRAIAARMQPFLALSAPPRDADFARLRWAFVRELSLHLAIERRGHDRWRAAAPVRAAVLDDTFEATFARHAADWTGAALVDHWDQYRVEATQLLARLRTRMAFEESTVLPALAR